MNRLLRAAAVSLSLLMSPLAAITLTQTYNGAINPPSIPGYWNYSPDVAVLPNGRLAMYFCSGYHYGLCPSATNPTGDIKDFTTDVIRRSERIGTAWQNASEILCASNYGPYGANPSYPCSPGAPCAGFPSTGSDMFHSCDPSIVYFNGTYFLYYTASTNPTAVEGKASKIFLATSTNGLTFTKYSNANGPIPVIDYTGDQGAYGAGEASVIVDNGKLVIYYTHAFAPDNQQIEQRRATSTDGYNWTNDRVFQDGYRRTGTGSAIDLAGGLAVRKVSLGGSDSIYLMIYGFKDCSSNTPGLCEGGDLSYVGWQFSLDGIHFTPRSLTNTIATGGQAHNPGLSFPASNALTAFSSRFVDGDPGQWQLLSTDITINPETAYGSLDEITNYYEARGWAHDPDRGTNDAATALEPTGSIGASTPVRFRATNTSTSAVVYGPWTSAEECRSDLVPAGVAVDCYHGFRLPLRPHLSAGTWAVRVEAREFPASQGNTLVAFERTVTIPSPDAGGFYTVAPCRVLDTRDPNGEWGGPAIPANANRSFIISGRCGIPTTAKAIAANLTTLSPSASGTYVAYPHYQASPPLAHSGAFKPYENRGTSSMIRLSPDGTGAIRIQNSSNSSLNIILDVSGFFE